MPLFKDLVASLSTPKSIGRQTVFVVVGDAITLSSAVIPSMILARLISVSSMGTYRQMQYLVALISGLIEFGLANSVYRFWNSYEGQARVEYAKLLLLLGGAAGIVASVMLAVSSGIIAGIYRNPELHSALLITAAYPLATIPVELLRPILLSQGYSFKATLLETGFSLVSAIALIVPFALGWQLNDALGVWILFLLLRLLSIPLVLHTYLFKPGSWIDGTILKKVWGYLWPIHVGRFPGYVSSYADKVVASFSLSVQQFATYSLGAREIPFIGTIGYSVSGVLIPHLVEDAKKGDFEKLCLRWKSACERTALFTYPIAAFCVLNALPLMRFLFSDAYEESSVPFRVFAATTFIRNIEYASLAKVLGRSEIIMRAAFIAAGSLLLFMVILTPTLGPLGLALSYLMWSVVENGYFLVVYSRILHRPIASFFPLLRLALLLSIAVVSVVATNVLLGPIVKLGETHGFLLLGSKLGILFLGSMIIYGVLFYFTEKTHLHDNIQTLRKNANQ